MLLDEIPKAYDRDIAEAILYCVSRAKGENCGITPQEEITTFAAALVIDHYKKFGSYAFAVGSSSLAAEILKVGDKVDGVSPWKLRQPYFIEAARRVKEYYRSNADVIKEAL